MQPGNGGLLSPSGAPRRKHRPALCHSRKRRGRADGFLKFQLFALRREGNEENKGVLRPPRGQQLLFAPFTDPAARPHQRRQPRPPVISRLISSFGHDFPSPEQPGILFSPALSEHKSDSQVPGTYQLDEPFLLSVNYSEEISRGCDFGSLHRGMDFKCPRGEFHDPKNLAGRLCPGG